jgi:hypothetical protein
MPAQKETKEKLIDKVKFKAIIKLASDEK